MKWFFRGVLALLVAAPAFGQQTQTGTISGKVTMPDGSALPGVSVQATSRVLPQPRHTVTSANGEYRLPLLPPGDYEVTFTLSGMATAKRTATVVLRLDTPLNVALALQGVEGTVTVAAQATLVDTESSALNAALPAAVIDSLPVGQEYRDLVKLVPGVQYSEDSVRGPSAGGSGQDNTYAFDGVNVSLPLFGTLSAEPSSHDIEQFAVVKGGADATDFNRSGGIAINTVSRSGSSAFHGTLSYQLQPESFVADRKTISSSVFEEDKSWLVANVGGPVLHDRLFFYTSYYRPTSKRENRANLYGDVPDYESTRNEFFGKLTASPSDAILLNLSYRTSKRVDEHTSVSGEASAASTSNGSEGKQRIAIFEGSWIISDRSFATAKFTDFANPTQGKPDNVFSLEPRLDGSVDLDLAALDSQGLLAVPVPVSGQTAFNTFITPIIDRYGYLENGVRKGGGRVGGGSEFNDQDFYRRSYQVAYDHVLGSKVTHALHVGYMYSHEEEDLLRTSNGWGSITVPGGRINCPTASTCAGQPVFFQAQVQQQGILDVPTINSQYRSHNIEVNDSIKWADLSLSVGLLMSNDRLYGQGLKEKSGTVSGFELAPGHEYLMHEIKFKDTLQPRLGAVWAYNGASTVYANFARYVPAASSLPRAASWARNKATLVNAYFDATGNFIGSTPEAASSGKVFVDGIKPRKTDEFLIGTTRDLGKGWSARLHGRYRKSNNFWEDTNNNARVAFNPPPGIPRELYVPNLAAIQGEIGGSSYVIAALDGAFTKYYEAGLEAEWHGRNAYLRGSYVWSHYYGNFDQDNAASTGLLNDSNIFIGSSFIADGAGRQLWDFKYGDLRGDRRHQLKVYGYYGLPWRASLGIYGIYQSGQPWEFHSYEPYISQTTSTSDANRYAEPAGSRRLSAHHQIDLNYSQTIALGDQFRVEARLDVYNVMDKQTGYNVQDNVHSANPGRAQTFFDPRRLQVALRVEF